MSTELSRIPESGLNQTRAELEAQDELLAILLNKHDYSWKIGDIFWCKYTRGNSGEIYAKLVGLRWNGEDGKEWVGGYAAKEDAPKWHERNIVVILYHPNYQNDYYKTPYYEVTLEKLFEHGNARYVGDESSIKQIEADVEAIANQTVTIDKLVEEAFPPTPMSEQTGVMVMNKDVILERKRELLEKQQFINIRLSQAKDLLEQRKWQLQQFTSGLMAMVAKLNRLIWSIELFLGIKEELVQFGFGPTAPSDDPICFRQRLLYMDEEVGDPTDDFNGLDFKKIETFDEWLMKYNTYWNCYNYEMMIPESKCVVIFRVRRNSKDYHPNPWINGFMNQPNMLTYVLIRNGENIFRVYADIVMGTKLFPDQDELTSLVETMEGQNGLEKESDINRKYRDVETAEEILERYKLNMILFQGIIERTPCFPDNAASTNIFAKDGYGDKIKFIYDDTNRLQLPTNTPTFNEWMSKLNEDIDEGSRVYITSALRRSESRKERDSSRFFRTRYENEYNIPQSPGKGLYQVYAATRMSREQKYTRKKDSQYHKDEHLIPGATVTQSKDKDCWDVYIPPQPYQQLFIKYNPGGDVVWSWGDDRDWGDRQRKNRLSWAIYTNDGFLCNWDKITRDDLKTLEFYMYTRIGRADYLQYIPALLELLNEKKKEMAEEDNFIKLCLSQAGLDPEVYFEMGIKAMDWWKLKNKWKRALTVDDSKALRMIVQRLKKLK